MGGHNSNTTLELIRNGDDTALRQVYVDNRKRFINFARKQGLGTEDAKDVYQDTFIAFRENILMGKVKSLNSSVSTYLFGIGKHLIRYRIRMNSRSINKPLLTINETKEVLDVNFLGGKVTKEQRLLRKGLKKLGTKCIEVLEMFFLKGYVLDEIVEILHYKNKKVLGSQKSRCISQLREIIKHL
jgi:RNA polymerase sigma-70 factor (ECF subfamily)